jgi:hypothetical protein
MTTIAQIGEHLIEIPSPVRGKSEILFSTEKDGFWDRKKLIKEYRQIWFDYIPYITKIYQQATLYDQDDILISLNKEDSDYISRIYAQEMNRRRFGVFFNNGGEVEYITGHHYFVLMWAKIKRHDGMGDYADYRDFQRDYFYLIDHVNNSKNILGLFFSKPKKTGITNLHWLYYLNKSTLTKNVNLGNMNIEQGQAAKTFRDYYLYAYNGLIPALRPNYKNKSENEGSIILGKSYSTSKKAKLMAYDTDDELNTSVFCVPTKDKSFDVAVMNDIWFDEPPKYKQPFGEIFRTNKEAVKIQSKINGRAWLTSYTPEEDSESFRQSRQIFLESELKTILPSSGGQTKTGLICHHLPAYVAWEGAFDKYGRCNEKKASREIESERNKVKGDKRALQAITRQYANNKREAWGSAGAGSTFDNIRLMQLLADLEIDEHNSPQQGYVEGNLIWDSKPLWNTGLRNKRKKGEFTNVKFVPLTIDEVENGVTGKFRLYVPIPMEQQNMALKFGRDDNNFLLPPDKFKSVMAADPTNYAAGSAVVEGSKNAGYTMGVPDLISDNRIKRIETKVIQLEYFDRAELPDEAFEDYLMMIIYTGSLALIEGNSPYVFTRLMEEGLGYYLLVKEDNGGFFTTWKRYMGLPNEPDKKYKSIKITSNGTDKTMMEALVRVIKNYIEKPSDGETDYGKYIKSTRLLKQIMDFNPLDTRVYDLVMCFGWLLFALDIYMDILLNNPDDNESFDAYSAILQGFLSK